MKSGLIAFTTTMTTGYNSIQFHQWTENTYRRVLSTSSSIDYENWQVYGAKVTQFNLQV